MGLVVIPVDHKLGVGKDIIEIDVIEQIIDHRVLHHPISLSAFLSVCDNDTQRMRIAQLKSLPWRKIMASGRILLFIYSLHHYSHLSMLCYVCNLSVLQFMCTSRTGMREAMLRCRQIRSVHPTPLTLITLCLRHRYRILHSLP